MIDRRFLGPAAIGLAVIVASTRASASEGYPAFMESDLGLDYTPGCDLCHESAKAPVGAADKAFCKSAIARGLVADDTTSLEKALKQMAADHVDSDADGAEDLDELSWGGDPNKPDLPMGGRIQPPQFGCAWSAREAPEPHACAFVIGALAFVVRSARRGQRPRRERSSRPPKTGGHQ